MEVVRGRSYLGHLEVDIPCCQALEVAVYCIVGLRIDILEKALYMAGRVLWAGTVEAMGQEKHHTALSEPLGLRAHKVLIDHQLGRVVEVTELCLPQTQVLGAFQGVAVLIGHGAQLVQVSIQDVEPALGIRSHVLCILQRGGKLVTLQRLLVMKNCMPMRKSAALHVLPDDTHVVPVDGQGTNSHRLGRGPVKLVLVK